MSACRYCGGRSEHCHWCGGSGADTEIVVTRPHRRAHLLNLDDEKLIELLADLRARAAPGHVADAETIESAIAELETEASCRGLALPVECHEPTPHSLALNLVWKGFLRGDLPTVMRNMLQLRVDALWLVYRRLPNFVGESGRVTVLQHLLFCVDRAVLGEERALQRRASLDGGGLSADDRVAYMIQCLNALFGGVLAWGMEAETDGE